MSTTPIHNADLAVLRELAAQTSKEQTAILHEKLAAYLAVMSEREALLYTKHDALGSVLQGLREAAAGEVHDLGSFVLKATDGTDVKYRHVPSACLNDDRDIVRA